MAEDFEPDLTDVVARAYSALAQPGQFVQLLPEIVESGSRPGGLGEEAEQHFANAARIFDRLYPLENADFDAISTRRGDDIASDLALDTDMRVLASNPAIFTHLALEDGTYLPDWLFDPVTMPRDQKALRAVPERTEPIFLKLHADGPEKPPRWFAARAAHDGTAPVAVLHAVRLRWHDRGGEAFAEALGLTDTEAALVRHLVTGGSIREFAERRGRSVGTARNQLKALQRKLSINSKEDLLLLYAGFIHSLDIAREGKEDEGKRSANVLALGDDRAIAFEEYGRPGGIPALYFHPLEGPLFPKAVERAAHEHGLRIIAPWRPGLGQSTPQGSGTRSPLRHGDTFAELLDKLGIERCAAFAMQAGAPFMFGMAQTHPDRISGCVGAGAFLPIAEKQDFEHLTFRQRIHVRTSRVAPAFARTYMRAMLASLGTGDFYRFVEDYYEGCERELTTVHDPEIVALFRRAARYGLPTGTQGMMDTMLNWSSDWSSLVRGLGMPVRLLVGDEDSSIPPSFAAAFAQRHSLPAPEVVEGAGSFLLYDRPDAVMRTLREVSG